MPDKRMKWIPTILKREIIKRKDSIKLHWYQGKNVCSLSKKYRLHSKTSKKQEQFLKETQTFKTYLTESYKYCIIVAGKTKISKTHGLLNKI